MYICNCCSYSTASSANYRRHLDTSKHKKLFNELSEKSATNNKLLLTIISRMEETINKLQDRVTDLENTLSKKQNTQTYESKGSMIVNNNKIGTINQSVNIEIKCFGNESIEHISDDVKKDILNSPNMALRTLLKYIHFNPEKREFQNIKWTNMQNPVIKTLRQDGWNLENRDIALDELCRNLVSFIDDIREEKGESAFKNRSYREKFDELVNILTSNDNKLSDESKKKLKEEKRTLGRYLYQLTKEIDNKKK